jgi:mono/diheme cytochrome c family protein
MLNESRVPVSVLACLGMAVLAIAAPGGTAPPKLDKAAAAKGRTTFVRYCVSCHGMEAKGDGPLAKDLRVPVPDLTQLTEGGVYPYDRVVLSVAKGGTVKGHGTDDMPAWGPAFSRTQGTETTTVDQAIHHVAHYIWSIQKK